MKHLVELFVLMNLARFKIIPSFFDRNLQELLHGASIAFALKVLGVSLSFVLNVVLARLLGAEGAGVFFLAFTVVFMIATAGMAGMENVLVRFVAVNVAAKQLGKVLGVYQKVMFYSSVVAVTVSLLLYLLAPWISRVLFNKLELEQPLSIMAFAVVPLTLLTLHASALQGLKKIAVSICVLSVFVPFFTCLIAVVFSGRYGINAVAFGYVVATGVTLLLSRWFWKKATSSFGVNIVMFNRQELFSCSMPMWSVVLMNMVVQWSPILFLGVWENSANIGIYSVASRTAALTSIVLFAVNSIAAPKYAAIYQQRDLKNLGKIARCSTAIMVILTIPVLLLFCVFPEWILSIFGEQFKQGAMILVILASAQFVNVATGSVGYLLMMSGNERLMRNNLLFCMILVILLNFCLIPKFGILGAAISVAFTLSIQNIIAMILVWKKIHIMTLPWMFSTFRE